MKLFFTCIIILFFSHLSEGQNLSAVKGLDYSDNLLTNEQKDLIFEKTKSFPNNTEISFAVITDGSVEYYGITRTEDTIRFSNNYQKIFEIGSLSKVFTSTLLADFVVAKKLKLTDQIKDYLDLSIKSAEPIRFLELSNHTSGLPRLPSNLNLMTVDPSNPYKDYGEDQLKEYLKEELKLNQAPGLKYEYSNLGAGLLGYILTKISNTTFEEMIQKNIFSKYKMSSSTSNLSHVKGELVIGRDAAGNKTSNWELNVLVGAGGILSNTEDLSKFALAQFNSKNDELELTQKPTFKINSNMSIGLGWHIIAAQSGDTWIWHNGGTGGYSSSMALDIENKNGVIILSNVSAFH